MLRAPNFANGFATRGEILNHLNKDDQALLDLTRAISAGINRPSTLFARASILFVRGDHAGSVRDYNSVVESNPKDHNVLAFALSARAKAYAYLDKFVEAKADADRSLELDPMQGGFGAQGLILERQGKKIDALTSYRKATAKNRNDVFSEQRIRLLTASQQERPTFTLLPIAPKAADSKLPPDTKGSTPTPPPNSEPSGAPPMFPNGLY